MKFNFLSRFAALAVLPVLCCALSPSQAIAQTTNNPKAAPAITSAGAAFSVAQNARFGAVAQGYAGAIGIESSGTGTASAFAALQKNAVVRAQLGPRDSAVRSLRRLHALGAHTPLRATQIIAYTRDGALPVRAALSTKSGAASLSEKSVGPRATNAPLTFKFSGFSAQQLTDFSAFRDRAYPLMVNLYGAPAPTQQGRVVVVQYDQTAGDSIYELPPSNSATSGGTIRYDPIVAGSGTTTAQALAINNYNLTRAMLIAFHGSQIFAFDAWERGFADAAALIVNYQANPVANFDPSQLGVYLLPIYDLLNRPELGNPFFFAPNTSPNLGFYRLGMAQAAWLKVWVQNPNFFKSFNTAYYAAYSTQLAGNTPALKNIALGIVPQVEALGFNDWYRRQNILDTAITTGEKLWLAIVPQANLTSGDTRSVFFGVAQHYVTVANGDETPVGGTGTVSAADENGLNLNGVSEELRADNRAVFNALGEAELNGQNVSPDLLPIIGFTGTGTPDLTRVTITVRVGNAEASALFPYNVSGTVSAPSGLYGATVGADSGTLALHINGTLYPTTIWQRGVFRSAPRYPSQARVFSQYTYNFATDLAGTGTRTVQRNSAWSYFDGRAQSLATVLQATPASSQVSLNLSTVDDNRLRMISLPLMPVQSDEAAVLGTAARALLLARYRPNLSPQGFSAGGVTYGVTADKHELYPNIAEPFAPGRGYWLKLNTPLSATVRGSEPSRLRTYEVPLLGGWNQVGVPFNLAFALSAVGVKKGDSAAVTFANAISAGWIGAGVWRWKPEGGYSRVDAGTAANQQLQPFEGVYIYSRLARDVKLVFDAKMPQTRALTDGALSATNWKLFLAASAGTALERDGSFGVSDVVSGKPLRVAAAKSPAATRGLTLSFLSSGNAGLDATHAGDASGWSDSLVAPFTTTAKWNFLIDGTNAGETVRLGWGDAAALPVAVDLTLVDEKTGKRTLMSPDTAGKSLRNYEFIADGVARKFHIEAAVRPPLLSAVSVESLAASRIALISARLTGIAKVDLDIETPGGDTVRNLATAQITNAGTTRWSWDGRNWQGRTMPVGEYIAHLTVRDARSRISVEKKVRLALQ